MSATAEILLQRIFPPDGQTIPVNVARNWPAVELAVKQLAAAMNGEQNDIPAAGKAARTPEWYAARNERIYRIMDENPTAPAREIARLAGVSDGVIKNLSRKKLHSAETRKQDHFVGLDDMVLIELKPVKKAEPVQAVTPLEESKQKSKTVFLQDAKPAQIEPPLKPAQELGADNSEPVRTGSGTIRESQTVEKNSGPKIPHSEDDLIFELRTSGKTFSQIQKILQERGIECGTSDIAPRYYSLKKKAGSMEVKPTLEKSKLSAIDAAILRMADGDALLSEICIAINRNFNQNLSTGEMAERIRKLQQGVDI